MIIDLDKFLRQERPFWAELERGLDKLEAGKPAALELQEAKRLHYLYERASADLGRISTFSAEPEIRQSLEALVARAYSTLHATRAGRRPSPLLWLFHAFPCAFRRRWRAFAVSAGMTLLGCFFGALALSLDPEAKPIILPFPHLLGDPKDRVAEEEKPIGDRHDGMRATFSATLMQNNIGVAAKALALGMTYGIGTLILLFYNGVILGAVGFDYVQAGQTKFLLGWLLPHGATEIPAILLAGQAGLVLANALLGRRSRRRVGERLRAVSGDVMTLFFGICVLLLWAGFVESYLSQHHEPRIAYVTKIAIGCVELAALGLYLGLSGRRSPWERGEGARS